MKNTYTIKTFEEFIADNKNIEEGKLKNITLSAAALAGLAVGHNNYNPHVNDDSNEKTEITNSKPNPGENFYPSEDILNYIKSAEGWHQGWKNDGKGNKTTGWGFKITPELRKKFPNGMTKKQADDYFSDIAIPKRVNEFIKAVPNIESYTQNQLDALFDLFYNIGYGKFTKGSPSLQKALKNYDIKKIISEMDHDYNNKNMSGAKKRRDYERTLFLQDMKKMVDL